MIILNKGEKLFPIVDYGQIRVYSMKVPQSSFMGGPARPFELEQRIGIYQAENSPMSIGLGALNNLLVGTRASNIVVGQEQVHQDGTELKGIQVGEAIKLVAEVLKEKIGFNYLLDFIDQKPVLVVLLRPIIFEGH